MSSLSPLDLLLLPDDEQAIIRCLLQQPGLPLRDIAERTQGHVSDLEVTIQRMVRETRLVEQLQGGQRLFSVRFAKSKKRASDASSALLALFNESLGTFLAHVALTSVLSESERDELASLCTQRTLLPDEVCIWQSNVFDQIGLVQIGLLKRSRVQGGQHADLTIGYIHRAEWFGVSEMFGVVSSTETFSAVIETELLMWPTAALLGFIRRHAHFSLAISAWISRRLHQCHEQPGQGHVWVVEAATVHAGATILATNLASLSVQGMHTGKQADRGTVLLWDLQNYRPSASLQPQKSSIADLDQVLEPHPSGFDVLRGTVPSDYPPHVQLDILLTLLQARYTYIICDTGTTQSDELLLRLRGRAHTLMTVTQDAARVVLIVNRWNESRPYARLGQKRMAVLNHLADTDQPVDSIFQVVLPYDPKAIAVAQTLARPVVEAMPDSSLSLALYEVYRRLSLTHTIGIFIPSTVNVDQPIDNGSQVQEALTFLGTTFGGATRNEAEGAWSSQTTGLVVEQVTIVRSFVSEKALQQKLDEVIIFVRGLKKSMNQEAMAVDVDNQLILV